MSKYDLPLRTPLLNAAGSLGFAPDPRGPVNLGRLGAFFTNPVSLAPRTPAHGQRCLPFAGGFLLHTGYPNPGLNAVIRRHARRWVSASLPVVVHLLPQQVEEVSRMLERLEDVEGVAGYELGLPTELDAASVAAFVRAAAGERPVIARLPLARAAGLAGAAAQAGAVAVSLAPPRGALPAQDGLVHGRLYGPALLPLALEVVSAIARQGIAVIGAGGLYRQEDVNAMLSAGAAAVQLDAVFWRGE
jgi:dihydroorotate dehydrogenase (NAD+) catalytic subunit